MTVRLGLPGWVEFRRGQLRERDEIALMLNSVDVFKMKDGELREMTADEMRRHIYGLVLNRT